MFASCRRHLALSTQDLPSAPRALELGVFTVTIESGGTLACKVFLGSKRGARRHPLHGLPRWAPADRTGVRGAPEGVRRRLVRRARPR